MSNKKAKLGTASLSLTKIGQAEALSCGSGKGDSFAINELRQEVKLVDFTPIRLFVL